MRRLRRARIPKAKHLNVTGHRRRVKAFWDRVASEARAKEATKRARAIG